MTDKELLLYVLLIIVYCVMFLCLTSVRDRMNYRMRVIIAFVLALAIIMIGAL